MKIELLLVGKTVNQHFVAGIKDYVERVNHYIPLTITIIPDLKNNRKMTETQQKILEGQQLLKRINHSDTVVLLDEHGKELRSVEMASWLLKQQQKVKKLVFVIGGPYGFSPDMYARANEKLSLSRLTFSHQMVRLIFVEQIYRACTIIKGEPYHHE